jgi:hypothetical protein
MRSRGARCGSTPTPGTMVGATSVPHRSVGCDSPPVGATIRIAKLVRMVKDDEVGPMTWESLRCSFQCS